MQLYWEWFMCYQYETLQSIKNGHAKRLIEAVNEFGLTDGTKDDGQQYSNLYELHGSVLVPPFAIYLKAHIQHQRI